ncbi:MAG TPA: hypothetical protein VF266_05800 [Thermoanaerobaculia bacterium]
MPNAAGDSSLLATPREVWETIKTHGGLDLEFHDAMDEDVVWSLVRALGGSETDAIEDIVNAPSLTVERFVSALLEALNPFSAMMSDLLTLFEKVHAKQTDNSLQVEFDFEHTPKLSFDLRQFRDWIERVQKVRELIRVPQWSYESLWKLSGVVRSSTRGGVTPDADPWLYEYFEERRWPEIELPSPSSGDLVFDATLRKVHEVWTTVVRETKKFGTDRNDIHDRARAVRANGEGAEDAWNIQFVGGVDHDNWAGSFAAGMHEKARHVRNLAEGERRAFVDPIVAAVEGVFAGVPSSIVERDMLQKVLIEFLNLPIWQRRHELYSAWVVTVLAEALRAHDLRFHTDDGRLSFSFGGSHLATAEATVPRLHIWAELRSPLEKTSALSGRNNIQPDYTLITDPITSAGSAVVVVECKQYRRFSKSNFSKAVIDYAHGRPNAHVVLVNYGPTRDDFLSLLPADEANRISLIGHLRPGRAEERSRFLATVRKALLARYPAPAGEVTLQPRIPIATAHAAALQSIQLAWGLAPLDLDLHLALWHAGAWTSIDFRETGNNGVFPWASLDTDVRNGTGPETITIAKVLATTYRCYVHNYSGDGRLAGSGATVDVRYRDADLRLTSPAAGTGRFWHVFDYIAEDDVLIAINAIVDAEPLHAGDAPIQKRMSRPSPARN